MTISMDPNLLRLGPLLISWHGLLTALGVMVAVLVAARLARRTGMVPDEVYNVAIWAIPGGIIGARLFHVVDRWDFYSQNLGSIVRLTDGGIAIWGAIIGGFVAGVIAAKLKGYSIGRLADVAAPGMILGQMVGRVGCTINGDAYGGPTSVPWALVYSHPGAYLPPNWVAERVPTHPWPIYEIMASALILFIVWRLWGRLKPTGSIFVVYVALYALARFFLTFLRQEQLHLGQLQEAQLISLAVLAIAVPLLAFRASFRQPSPAA
ncbi:MAG: prolipoprotein diacylglyceryl transferase [Chloroflexi bacterium]|nr:prolipoprotein diacylglyceryl transferase [Chloroflexota bacterium]